MRGGLSLPAAVFVAAMSVGLDRPDSIWPNIGSVQAGETYTRKRVNGVWIRGYFTRRQSENAATQVSAPAPDLIKPLPQTMGMQAASPLAEPAPSPPEHDPMALLRRGLEARAKAMAATAPDAAPALKVLTYDFETGYRTAVYTDGSVKREPFDRIDMTAIAGTSR